jgi:hypothetical protein
LAKFDLDLEIQWLVEMEIQIVLAMKQWASSLMPMEMRAWREVKVEALWHMIQMREKQLHLKKAAELWRKKVVVERLELVFRMFEEAEKPNWKRSCWTSAEVGR